MRRSNLSAIWKWLRRRWRMESEMDEELRFHIDAYAADLEGSGVSRADAERRARLEFGGIEVAKDDCRRAVGVRLIDDLRHDLRYSARVIVRRPGFSAAAILMLALGIGANISIFNLLHALLIEPLAVTKPSDLVAIEENGMDVFAYPAYDELRRKSRSLSVIAMSRHFERPNEIQESAGRFAAFVQMVSDDYFDVLGVGPLRGRVFGDSSEPVAVISESWWRRHFAASPSALGAVFRIYNRDFTIAGIAPPEFRGAEIETPTDIWIPMEQALPTGSDTRLRGRMFHMMARLRAGATMAQAAAEAAAVLQKPITARRGATGYSTLRGRLKRPLLLLQLLVALVLLIACANLANLVMAGAASRGRELAARQALGAQRGRLARQLFTENLLISLAGGTLALAVAYWTTAALLSFLPPEQAAAVPRLRLHLDLRLIAASALLSFLSSLLFGLAPALRATRMSAPSLVRTGARSIVREGAWMRRGLVIGEVCMCTLLLIVSAVFVRTLQNLRWQDTGFQEEQLLVADVELPREYRELQRDRYYEELRARIAALPGVWTAAYSHLGQLSGYSLEYRVNAPGVGGRLTGRDQEAYEQRVTPGFLGAMGTRLLVGRDFTEHDDANAPAVAIVNEAFARRFFPGADAVGKQFMVERIDRSRSWDSIAVVGMVKDSKWINLRDASPVMYYRPYRQSSGRPTVRFAARTSGDLRALAGAFTQTARALDPRVVLRNVVPFSEIVDRTLLNERLIAQVSSVFGILALLIAAIGLYGVLAYGVARRRREIGVRIAIGASAKSVEWMFLRESLGLLGAGFALGVPAALVVTRLVSALLYGLGPADPLAIGVALAILAAATIAAAYVPARRAATTDPAVVLREE